MKKDRARQIAKWIIGFMINLVVTFPMDNGL